MALHVLNHLLPFQVLLFSLFQLPFLYNYMGRSSERECSVADRPSKNRACWSQNLHPYLPWAVGKVYVLIAQEKLFEDIRPKHFVVGSLPRLAPGWTVCNCSPCPVESYKPYVQGSTPFIPAEWLPLWQQESMKLYLIAIWTQWEPFK